MPNSRNALVALNAGMVLLVAGVVGGCVPGGVLTNRNSVQASTVAPIYVPTTKYDGHTCGQLAAEIQTTNATIADMSGKLERGEYDKSGSLIVTPLFLMYDNTSANDETPKKTQELGRLKGVLMSLREAAGKRRCAIPS